MSFIKIANDVLKTFALSLVIFMPANNLAFADSGLRALSVNKDDKIAEQDVSVKMENGKLELNILWKKTNPILFNQLNRIEYINFFDTLISGWDGYVRSAKKADKNTISLAYLTTYDGEISVHFFMRLANGKDFFDNQPRIRMVYCKNNGMHCIDGQVHFYTKEQLLILQNIVLEKL